MKCEECGEEFEPRTGNQKFCNEQHRRRHLKRRYRQNKAAKAAEEKKASEQAEVLQEVMGKAGVRQAGALKYYDPEERDFYLRAIALAGGNCAAAFRGLKELGFSVKKDTLSDFKRDHADRYTQIREQVAPELKAQRAEAHEALSDKLTDLADDVVNAIREALEAGEFKPNQLAGVLRDASVSAGINRDKAAKLRGEEIKVVHYKTPDEIYAQLRRVAPGMIIEGEAKEIAPPAKD